MGTLSAKSIVDRAAQSLKDADYTQWTLAELVGYLSDAQRAAVLLRPEVNPVTDVVQLVVGSKQMLPPDAFVLIGVNRNMRDTGRVENSKKIYRPMRAITPSTLDDMNRIDPMWHIPETPPPLAEAEARRTFFDDATITNSIYDTSNRHVWYCHPAVPDPHPDPHPDPEFLGYYAEIVYAKAPDEIGLTGSGNLQNTTPKIGLDDVYQPALLAYMLHRAYAKDAPVEGNSMERSAAYFNQFAAMITGDTNLLVPNQPLVEGDVNTNINTQTNTNR